jgi:hypothetical protein
MMKLAAVSHSFASVPINSVPDPLQRYGNYDQDQHQAAEEAV